MIKSSDETQGSASARDALETLTPKELLDRLVAQKQFAWQSPLLAEILRRLEQAERDHQAARALESKQEMEQRRQVEQMRKALEQISKGRHFSYGTIPEAHCHWCDGSWRTDATEEFHQHDCAVILARAALAKARGISESTD